MFGAIARDVRLKLAWSLALSLALGMHAVACLSQAPVRHAENYTTRLWQTRDGLPQETVQAVTQTHDGFLWIGTTGGLLRFDGSRFVTYDRANTPEMKENSVFSLMTSHDGTLWIGTEGGGLICMREGVFRQFGAAEGLSDGFVRAVLEDADGRLWIGTDNGLFLLENGASSHVKRVDQTRGLPALAVHALAEGADHTVWIGGSSLFALRKGVPVSYRLEGEYSETRVKSLLEARDGTVWVGTVSGLERRRPGAAHFERFVGVQGTVRTLRQTDDGTLWIGTIGAGAYTLSHGVLAAVGAGHAGDLVPPSKTTLSLFDDREHNVWMGTQAGLLRFSRSPVELVPLLHASDSDFETISRDRDGSLWIAGADLTHLVDGVATHVRWPWLLGARVRNVFRAKDSSLWIGTDGRGLFHRLKDPATGQITIEQVTTAQGLANNFVRGMLQTQDDALWIALDEGVTRIQHGVLKSFTVQDGLAYFSVRSMLEDRAGTLWIGTDRGLSHLAGDTFIQDEATHALTGEKVWALVETADGSLWMGTRDNGLFRYVSATRVVSHLTAEQGLASDSVFQILDDGRGRFWISGAGGVSVTPIADLEQCSTDPRSRLSKRFFPVSTGGELTPLYGGTMPAGVLADNDIWFPTSKGPVRFLVGEREVTRVPRVFLDQVVADGRLLPAVTGQVDLAAASRNLEIAYGSILLGPQDAVQFQYKLDGFDAGWRYGSNRRVADYTNLPAGRYLFHVRAFEGGGAGLTERTLLVIQHQYFYLSWWFLTGMVVVLALIVWWMHRQKLRRVRLAFQAVLDERARLAREMHDTLIQGCAGVSLLLEAASAASGQSSSGQQDLMPHDLLDYARTQLASAMDEARQAVWNLRGEASTDFEETLRKLAERLDRSSQVKVEYVISGRSYAFHETALYEITMASREAIYNALLHAHPTRIVVHASFGEEEFSITVEDDGSGFDTAQTSAAGHYGLTGIEERVRRLGGSVCVTSGVQSGTTVSCATSLCCGTKISICVPRTGVSTAVRGTELKVLEEVSS